MAELMRSALDGVLALGAPGQLLFVLLYAAACVLFFPAVLLTLAGGAAFGLARGFLLVWAGASLGLCLSFLAGRSWLRGWVRHRLEPFPVFRAISKAVEREGWRVVLLTRLSPALPFGLLNYGFGLTGVAFAPYAWASFVGIIPGTLLYVWLGAAAGDAARAEAGERMRTPAEWALFAVGLAATVAVVTLVGRAARRALEEEKAA